MTMARKRHGRRRNRRLGSIITVKRLSGVERVSNPSSATGAILPVVLGGTAALLSAVGIRQWVQPTADNATVVQNADWIGLGVGGLVGLTLWNMASKPAGLAALAGAGLVTLAARLPMMMMSGGIASMPAGNGNGTGAIVVERSNGMQRGRRGVGAIVMQPANTTGYGYGPHGGENVSLQGLSAAAAIQPSAFGTPSFTMGR